MSNPEKEQPITEGSIDHLPGDDAQPLDADEGEPDVQPYGGDDDIASGHVAPNA